MKEARFYSKVKEKVRCALCSHRCTFGEGRRGICGVRENRGGTLYSLVYGKAAAVNVDPIEKKPLFNFYPGTTAYSLATAGCNFRCLYCQNWELSQDPKEPPGAVAGRELMPEDIVREALDYGCRSIAYTYTEPTVFYEYAYDTAVLAHEKGLKNVFVTNGYITGEPLREISPYLDAANIDLKAFTEEFYRKVCGARLQPVLDSIELYKELGIWVEVTTLLIPGYNDSEKELRGTAEFIAGLGEETPWHVSAFYPDYKLLDVPPTPAETLRRARRIGVEAGLRYVYEGNIPGEGWEDTRCRCGDVLIRRLGFGIRENKLEDGKCPSCGRALDGVFA